MTTRSILVAASGGTASGGAIEIACRLAQHLGAVVEGFHVQPDPRNLVAMAGGAFDMPLSGAWIDRFMADAAALAKETEAAFRAAAARHRLAEAASCAAPGAGALWRTAAGYAPLLVARRARFFDLVVLGRSERVIARPHTDTVEETLLSSGRPVLLAPAKPPAKLGETVALGWNGSAESVHAMVAALPVLAKAKTVILVTIGDDADDQANPDPEAALGYLAAHGIAARHRNVLPVAGVGAGAQVLAEARDQDADLLVMGAYGERPWREVLFGGATRDVVAHSLLPVLLAH